MIVSSNHLAKLGIGAAHRLRLELSDRLFFPVAIDFENPSLPMFGGSIANRGGVPVLLSSPNVPTANGNTGGYKAEFSPIDGDAVTIIRKKTSDGINFSVGDFEGKEIAVEDPAVVGLSAYKGIPRYLIKADGAIYDILRISGFDDAPTNNYQHWAISNGVGGTHAGGGYAAGTYTPPAVTSSFSAVIDTLYDRPVGRISFRAKSGASSQLIQDNISRVGSALDSMSRLLGTLHDEGKGPFANIILR